MNSSSDVSLSKKGEWGNWPLWLKGIFVLWPSLSTAYLFLTDIPGIEGSGDMSVILRNVEYQNYFISYFVGFWAINLVLLGIGWIIVSMISGISGSGRKKSKKKVRKKRASDKKTSKTKDNKKSPKVLSKKK